jgi:hypothetical protein
MTEQATPVNEDVIPVNKDVIDGSRVAKRGTARIFTPLSKYPDGLSPTYGVDFCTLEDGREVYQCVHPSSDTCMYWHPNGVSVRSHLRVHTLAMQRAEVNRIKAERDELLANEERRRDNYRLGALKGVANRRAARENGTKEASATSAPTENGNEAKGMTPAQYEKKINNAQTSLEGASDGIVKVMTILSNINKTLVNVTATLEDLGSTELAADPVLAEKAASWDAMQALLNPKTVPNSNSSPKKR